MKVLMDKSLTVKHITLRDGERHKLLVSADSGIPLYYPSLYITSHVRGAGHSVSTIQAAITALKVMYSWLDHYGLDIESRFQQAELLTQNEIISLRDFAKKPLKDEEAPTKVLSFSARSEGRMGLVKRATAVASETQYSRMTAIADYLKFLAETLTSGRRNKALAKDIESMWKRIKSHRPKKKGRATQDRDDKGLDLEVVDKVLEFLQPGHEQNPFQDEGVQLRNALIVTLLRHLGIRRGELLNVRVDDIDFTANEFRIVRRPDSGKDQRTFQPLVKTLERTLVISSLLAQKLSHYVLKSRSQFSQARRHPYLFVTHKAGPSQGAPLSNSSFGKLMGVLQGMADEMGGVHAHAFRHTWNYEFSSRLDESGSGVSPEKEEQMRSYMMGWSETSGTAATYNKRHIKEKAKEASLDFQKSLNKKKGGCDAE